MRKPMMAVVTALIAIGMFATVPRASAQMYPDKNALSDTYPPAYERNISLMSDADRDFVRQVGYEVVAQEQMSQLALDRASSGTVQQFAQLMLDENALIKGRLAKIADDWSILTPLTLDRRAQREYDRLSTLSGAAFDRAYVEWENRIHDRTIDRFKERLAYTHIDDLTHFISKDLPTLREHRKMARDLRKELGQ